LRTERLRNIQCDALFTTFKISLEKKLGSGVGKQSPSDHLFTTLRFSLEKNRRNAMPGNPILVPLKRLNMRWVWEVLTMCDRLFSTLTISLEKKWGSGVGKQSPCDFAKHSLREIALD
jgi:hypothetical protein